MKYLKTSVFSATICALLGATTVNAQQMTGLQVMQENDKQFSFQTETSQLTMELVNRSGKTRSRTVERYSAKDGKGNLSTLIRFLQPADVKGSGFLSVEHSKTDESRHLYLPALKKSRRISAGEDSDAFMGSDFTYEDLDEMELGEYSFKLLGEETVNGAKCHKVEAVPTNEKRRKTSGYSKRVYYVSHGAFVVNKVEYFDKHGTLFKKLTATDIKPVPGATGFYRAYVLTMENLKTKHKTVLAYKDYKINPEVDKNVFTLRFLERSN